MLKNSDIHDELSRLEEPIKDEEEFMAKLLKSQVIIAKLLHNIRQNQTSIMAGLGVSKVKPKHIEDSERLKRA